MSTVDAIAAAARKHGLDADAILEAYGLPTDTAQAIAHDLQAIRDAVDAMINNEWKKGNE